MLRVRRPLGYCSPSWTSFNHLLRIQKYVVLQHIRKSSEERENHKVLCMNLKDKMYKNQLYPYKLHCTISSHLFYLHYVKNSEVYYFTTYNVLIERKTIPRENLIFRIIPLESKISLLFLQKVNYQIKQFKLWKKY